MPGENPWAYNEARNRIREKQEAEKVIIEKKKEDFEMNKEKVYKKKKLDVFELKHRFETARSLWTLREDVKKALESGEISSDTYQNVIQSLDKQSYQNESLFQKPEPDFFFDPSVFPILHTPLDQYFDAQPLGKNIIVDIGGFTYGVVQGSVFLLYIAGKMCLDLLLLPRDIYHSFHP